MISIKKATFSRCVFNAPACTVDCNKTAGRVVIILQTSDDFGDCIPLSIADAVAGSINIVFLVEGKTTKDLSGFNIGHPIRETSCRKKVAVLASGHSGSLVAADNSLKGHHVTIFDAFHKLGGVLRYGIPEFRLPNEVIDKEIETVVAMGCRDQNKFCGRSHPETDRPD